MKIFTGPFLPSYDLRDDYSQDIRGTVKESGKMWSLITKTEFGLTVCMYYEAES